MQPMWRGMGEWEAASDSHTLPSSLGEMTGILNLFGLRKSHRDPDKSQLR